jgi:neutral ceramidase
MTATRVCELKKVVLMSEAILAGFGRVDITPAQDNPPTFEIFDPIYVRALHVRQGSRQVTFLAADLFVLDDHFHDLLARFLAGTDIDPEWVLPGASHLGTGPVLFHYYINQPTEALKRFGDDETYARAAAKAICLARADASPARVAVGTGEAAPNLSYNRRAYDDRGRLTMVPLAKYPQPPDNLRYDPVDRQVGLVRFDRQERRSIALTNFGCHALARPQGNISGDYPGRMAHLLALEGIDSLFFQGALGNVHPVRKGDDPSSRIAWSLADTVLKVFHTLQPAAEVELKFLAKTLELPRQPVSSVEEAKRRWESQSPDNEGLERYKYWLAQRYQELSPVPFALHAVVIGTAALLHMPGEPFVETTLAIRDALPFEHVLLLANPSPEVGYLPTPEAHQEGGDEPLFAPLDTQAEFEIRRAAIALLTA